MLIGYNGISGTNLGAHTTAGSMIGWIGVTILEKGSNREDYVVVIAIGTRLAMPIAPHIALLTNDLIALLTVNRLIL